jgi:hypothetical protein
VQRRGQAVGERVRIDDEDLHLLPENLVEKPAW